MSATTAWTPEGTFAERLALIRIHHGWNVKEAALACGISPATWRTWEGGASPHKYPEQCQQIAERAGIDYLWLMTGQVSAQHIRAKGGHSSGLALPMIAA